MKNRETTITWAILILVSIAVWGYAIKGFWHECPEPEPPTIAELQQFLGVEADGIIGKQTIKAYEEYSFNKYAAPYFTASGAPSGEN